VTGVIVGVGASRRATVDDVVAAVRSALCRVGSCAELLCLATAYEVGGAGVIDSAALSLGVSVRRLSEDRLGRAVVPSPSRAVEGHRGTASIAEAAVVASGASLLVPKQRHGLVAVAVGRFDAGGLP
jgi:hypothetical protein